MASMTYPKSNEFERIFYTAHSINREEDGYNLTFNFCNTLFQSFHSIFNPYIFVTGRKDSNQRRHKKDTIHYPQVSWQNSEDLAYFFIEYFHSDPICPKTALKIKYEDFVPFLISYAGIICLSIDVNVI